ncbi:hypothetical protein [Streptomyces griseorubiginosus]|uniref:hypothetical protein n=1 Tax=Streptomyces griseorubiginosus TaxID=67304 RepID=UPI003F5156AF
MKVNIGRRGPAGTARGPGPGWCAGRGTWAVFALAAAGALPTSQAGPGDHTERAFLWSAPEGMRDLGILSGGSTSLGQAITEQGQVSGYGDTADGSTHAFLWTP